MARKLPSVQLTPTEDLDALRRQAQVELNRIVDAVNRQDLAQNLEANNKRIQNMAPGVSPHDAINLEQLNGLAGLVDQRTLGQVRATTLFSQVAGVGNISVFRETLTGDVSVVAPTLVSEGDILIYVMIQDGSGGHSVTWGSEFTGAGFFQVGGKASTFTLFVYVVWDGSTFYIMGPPATNLNT